MATLRLQLAGGEELRQIALLLRKMNEPEVGRIFRRQLRGHVVAIQRDVRATIMAIPSDGDDHRSVSGGNITPLRVRLARCVRVTSRTTAEGGTGAGKVVQVAVWMDVHRMPRGQFSLPITEEGLKIWRHPTFGGVPWVVQSPHPLLLPCSSCSCR